ncbi:MAG: helicase-related protein [Dehalococcoidia bacterium]
MDIKRSNLVPHVVQRRRADLEQWMGWETPFPNREAIERQYTMSGKYASLFENIREYCQESVSTGGTGQQQRARYWAAIAILRCALSSPAAAEAMLDKRKARREEDSSADVEESDEFFRDQILDSVDEDQPADYVPTAAMDDPAASLSTDEVRRLDGFLRAARALSGPGPDHKVAAAIDTVDNLLKDGYRPIVYCRFIDTAEYVADQLQDALGRKHPGLQVASVTGGDGGSEQRRERIDILAENPVRVLVATDCLSEGINLQHHFDAVVHYDLPWNPNRLEQREGRIDRYGQQRTTIKTVLLYGADNEVDLVVLDVLIRKARTIRGQLGISVPVPVESQQVIQAVVDSVLLRKSQRSQQLRLDLTDPRVSSIHEQMDRDADRESKTRAYFAQRGIKPGEVERELQEMEPALGSAADIRQFMANAVQRFGGTLRENRRKGVFELDPGDLAPDMKLRSNISADFPVKVTFDDPTPDGITTLGRNHPFVAAVSDQVIRRALTSGDRQFSRSGAIYTDTVGVRTAVAILRVRYLLEEDESLQFAEEVAVAAFRRAADGGIEWVRPFQEEGLRLLRDARVTANMQDTEKQRQVTWALKALQQHGFEDIVGDRVGALEASHARLRSVLKARPLTVTPHEPPDILGCYVLVPSGGTR